jgi:hypothetical protein
MLLHQIKSERRITQARPPREFCKIEMFAQANVVLEKAGKKKAGQNSPAA